MHVPYPGSGETSGVIMSALVIVGLSVGLYALFRRNGWL
jgi:Mg2+ and Co2+ transporter CorA